MWSTLKGECIFTLEGHDNWIRGLAIHSNGKFLYSCGDDRSIRIWSLENGKVAKKYSDAHSHFISSIIFNNKYFILVTTGYDFIVKIWDLK